MAKGSPVVTMRLTAKTLKIVDEVIKLANSRRAQEPYTRSSFILSAVVDRLNKMERGRRSGIKFTVSPAGDLEAHRQPNLELS